MQETKENGLPFWKQLGVGQYVHVLNDKWLVGGDLNSGECGIKSIQMDATTLQSPLHLSEWEYFKYGHGKWIVDPTINFVSSGKMTEIS